MNPAHNSKIPCKSGFSALWTDEMQIFVGNSFENSRPACIYEML